MGDELAASRCDFDPLIVLSKPVMAHLATASPDGPRDSPVWFLWEDEAAWLFGYGQDSFPKRLSAEPRCALGIVDFNLERGVLRHVGIRGRASLLPIDADRLKRFVGRYLGPNEDAWNRWFVDNVVSPIDIMIRVDPETIVAKDVSHFRTGPDMAGR